MKNWVTTLIGIAYAALIVLLQQVVEGYIDWVTIGEAALSVFFGLKAADNVKAQGAYELLVVHWKTTIVGVLMGAGALLLTYKQAGEVLTWLSVLKAVGVSLMGILSNDGSDKNVANRWGQQNNT